MLNYISERRAFIFAAVSGLLLTAAFPKLSVGWLAWCALIPFLFSLKDTGPGEAFRIGFIAGLFHYCSLMYWLVATMQTYGHLPIYLAVPVLFLLTAYLALYFAFFAWGLVKLKLKPLPLLSIAPVLWTGLEYIRSFLLTGFPWELLGYSQFKHLQLIQMADIFGVYGLSFLIVAVNGVGCLLLLFLTQNEWQRERVKPASLLIGMAGVGILMAGAWQYGSWRLNAVNELAADAPAVTATIVQGNIEQAIKWEPSFQVSTTEKYVRLVETVSSGASNIVVWPETAVPFYLFHNRPLSRKVLGAVRQTRAWHLIGSPAFEKAGTGIHYFNSLYLVNPDGKPAGRYDKVHLVPFGEYVPLKKWLPFIKKMVAQVGDFKTGKKGDVLATPSARLGGLICYEAIFPELARAAARNGADVLINVTNDAWYGWSSAPYQHFSMAVFRAVENKRALVRSANTGISGFIGPSGKIMETSRLFTEKVMTKKLSVIKIETTYSRYGDWFAGCCLGISGMFIFLRRLRRK